MPGAMQEPPPRNSSLTGMGVYSHSGEFTRLSTDLIFPDRGLYDFSFMRGYRSGGVSDKTLLGYGWTFTYGQWLEDNGDGIVYHDGVGRLFTLERLAGTQDYTAPHILYAILARNGGSFELRQQTGPVAVFDLPDVGGRLRRLVDRNGNTTQINYGDSKIEVIDALGRIFELYLEDGLISQLTDPTARTWHYDYDDACLAQVTRPPTPGYPDGTTVRYAYDTSRRLLSVTDPRGHRFLTNEYDDLGRVVRQNHGTGYYEFRYDQVDTNQAGEPVYQTTVRLKNGGIATIRHDPAGHATEYTLAVTAAAVITEDRAGAGGATVPVTTRSSFNANSELVERTYPNGRTDRWFYDEHADDPRNQGNLLRFTAMPAPEADGDQPEITFAFTYWPEYQLIESIRDPRGHTISFSYDEHGNLTERRYPPVTVQTLDHGRTTSVAELVERFAYNPAGQLVRATDARGVHTDYHYYAAADPMGARGALGGTVSASEPGGFLASVIQDPASPGRASTTPPANVITGLEYDAYGNVAKVLDGRSNATRYEYDALNQLLAIVSRPPFSYRTEMTRDANGNLVKVTRHVAYSIYNAAVGTTSKVSGSISQRYDYDDLNNMIARQTIEGQNEITETFVLDEDERMVRWTDPLGNVATYTYDERDLVVTSRGAVGTASEAASNYAYSPSGQLRSLADGLGNTRLYSYDGFDRYSSTVDAVGTSMIRTRDAAGNVTSLRIEGQIPNPSSVPDGITFSNATLAQLTNSYDELNRLVRTDRVWLDPAKATSLGTGGWDGQNGVISTVVQYANNHRPSGIWVEGGNILKWVYDGANRINQVTDSVGHSISYNYDQNSNVVRTETQGPEIGGPPGQYREVALMAYDELDRRITRSVNGVAPERWTYNALNAITGYVNASGVETVQLHDGFGRWCGRVTQEGATGMTVLAYRLTWDDGGRASSVTDAGDRVTRYSYDELGRPIAVVFPDGTTQQYERDAAGNVVKAVKADGTRTSATYDQGNRLVALDARTPDGQRHMEKYQYDGLGRLVGASAEGGTIVRAYDSLSRLLAENQSGRTVRYVYDAAGNPVQMTYPSGLQIHREYDSFNRLIQVRDASESVLARYTYRAWTQRASMRLGSRLEAAYNYDQALNRVSSITYRTDDGAAPVDGASYVYDTVGNRLSEAQLRLGPSVGEQYSYDAASRLTGVKYGVADVANLSSEYKQSVSYDLASVDAWQQRTTASSASAPKSESATLNTRDAYTALGNRRFEYDANGNRSLQYIEPGRVVRYHYDWRNRLSGISSNSGELSYRYDSFSRQTLRRSTSADAENEISRIWSGPRVIEEWAGDQPVRSIIYTDRDPLQLRRHNSDGQDSAFYALNGRGFVTSLINETGERLESYTYDFFGEPSRDGVNPALPLSSLGNPVFARTEPWDSELGAYTGTGVTFEPSTAQRFEPSGLGIWSVQGGQTGFAGSSQIPTVSSALGGNILGGTRGNTYSPGMGWGNSYSPGLGSSGSGVATALLNGVGGQTEEDGWDVGGLLVGLVGVAVGEAGGLAGAVGFVLGVFLGSGVNISLEGQSQGLGVGGGDVGGGPACTPYGGGTGSAPACAKCTPAPACAKCTPAPACAKCTPAPACAKCTQPGTEPSCTVSGGGALNPQQSITSSGHGGDPGPDTTSGSGGAAIGMIGVQQSAHGGDPGPDPTGLSGGGVASQIIMLNYAMHGGDPGGPDDPTAGPTGTSSPAGASVGPGPVGPSVATPAAGLGVMGKSFASAGPQIGATASMRGF